MSGKSFFSTINNGVDKLFNSINTNKYLAGILMLVMNLGSRYITPDVSSPFHKALFSSKFMKRFIIFTIIFIATKDIKISLILTAAFVIIFLNLFNEKSDYCVLPQSFRNLDTNMDGEITADEIERAYSILQKTGKLPQAAKDIKKEAIKKKETNKTETNKINIDVYQPMTEII